MFSAMSLKEKLRRFWAMGPYDYLMFIFPFGVRLILICFIQISLLTTDTFVFFFVGGLRVEAERRTGRIFFDFQLL